jgi:hypothetical protein
LRVCGFAGLRVCGFAGLCICGLVACSSRGGSADAEVEAAVSQAKLMAAAAPAQSCQAPIVASTLRLSEAMLTELKRSASCREGSCCGTGAQRGLGHKPEWMKAVGECAVGGEGMNKVFSDAGQQRLLTKGGKDTVHLRSPGAYVHAGDGDDVVIGVPGLGGSGIVFGGSGDDTLILGDGDDVIVPGPGADHVQAGKGDDIILILDPCEVESGKHLDGGQGTDVLYSPFTPEELRQRGVRLCGIEHYVQVLLSCWSECRVKPACGAGACRPDEQSGALTCLCPPGTAPPSCTPVDVSAELEAKAEPRPPVMDDPIAFVDWFSRAQFGQMEEARQAILALSREQRAAFLQALKGHLATPRNQLTVGSAVELLAYLGSRDAILELAKMLVPHPPPPGAPIYDDHGTVIVDYEGLRAWRMPQLDLIDALAMQQNSLAWKELTSFIALCSDSGLRVTVVEKMIGNGAPQAAVDEAKALLSASELAELQRRAG